MPGSNPPPWIMKPSMTRWKISAVVVLVLDVAEEVLDRDRGLVLEQLDLDRAHVVSITTTGLAARAPLAATIPEHHEAERDHLD